MNLGSTIFINLNILAQRSSLAMNEKKKYKQADKIQIDKNISAKAHLNL